MCHRGALAQYLQAPRDRRLSQGPNIGSQGSSRPPPLEMTLKTSAFKFASILFTRCYDTRFFILAQGCVRLLELSDIPVL